MREEALEEQERQRRKRRLEVEWKKEEKRKRRKLEEVKRLRDISEREREKNKIKRKKLIEKEKKRQFAEAAKEHWEKRKKKVRKTKAWIDRHCLECKKGNWEKPGVKGVKCCKCTGWYHFRCQKEKKHPKILKNEEPWKCKYCSSIPE